ncbi:hypothetical protein [Jeotgalibaca arthritidis]|uniref:Uncharacterized protein n=1 Tax=Jeotgalibaca arthritidis TaxID=1868794 RepID=A0A6G7KBJ5_9LACT|nr:hypothetical protein [Jeotgalibaca arthritidis]QII82620.1 hypothetical protein G7057_09370 [Jeotgalibaca arthritidis]
MKESSFGAVRPVVAVILKEYPEMVLRPGASGVRALIATYEDEDCRKLQSVTVSMLKGKSFTVPASDIDHINMGTSRAHRSDDENWQELEDAAFHYRNTIADIFEF